MSDNPYIRLHGSDNRAAARGWDDGYAAGFAFAAGRAANTDDLIGALRELLAHPRSAAVSLTARQVLASVTGESVAEQMFRRSPPIQ